MKKIFSLLFVIAICLITAGISTFSVYAQEAKENTDDMEELLATVSTEDPFLEEEAKRLGIPGQETKRYIVTMKELNREYQDGDVTRTEYISNKRLIIEELK